VGAYPVQQVAVAADGGGELLIGQVPADRVDHRGVVGLAVRVDSAGNLRGVVRHAGLSVLASPFRGRHAPAGRADKTVTGLLNQAPIKSRMPVRSRVSGSSERIDGSSARQSEDVRLPMSQVRRRSH
jgi:hypothetical protein